MAMRMVVVMIVMVVIMMMRVIVNDFVIYFDFFFFFLICLIKLITIFINRNTSFQSISFEKKANKYTSIVLHNDCSFGSPLQSPYPG